MRDDGNDVEMDVFKKWKIKMNCIFFSFGNCKYCSIL